MQRAAKNKTIWLVLLALASVLPSPVIALSGLDQGVQNRVELFLRGAQNGTGRHPFEPAKRVENYDRRPGTASESPVASAPTEFIQTDVARSLGAARHPMMQRLDDVLTRHGGTQTADGYFHFGSRRSARAAASELAGDLGYAPVAIRKSDFRGGPWSWRNSNGVIGRQQLDPLDPTKSLSGWRDDILGHTFGDGATIGPHVNVWNEFFENLHLTY